MLFLSMTRPQAIEGPLDPSLAIELRLDLFPSLDLQFVKNFLQNSPSPVMLTLRKRSHGGGFNGTEEEREQLIQQLLSLEPPYFDLEYDMNPSFLQEVVRSYPNTQFVLSYHHLTESPIDLEVIYQTMQQEGPFCYKIAAMTPSSTEALKRLLFVKKHPNVSVICMGELGQFARVLGPIMGNRLNYGSFDSTAPSAAGQLSGQEWIDLYRYPVLDHNTAIYGLIGDPVIQSPGALYHNGRFRELQLNAVYVKIKVKPEELAEFLPLAKELGIRGLSVTMPLKEVIIPLIDAIDPAAKEMGAINTLLFQEGKIIGTNTDGVGALDALEKKGGVRGKQVVILGAGGAARSIAFEAKKRGAKLFIINRTIGRAKKLALEIGCEAGGLDEIPHEYDYLIHCSPHPIPIDPKARTIAMDVVYSPRETPFLQAALLKECQLVYGEEMFLNQAARQTAFWMSL